MFTSPPIRAIGHYDLRDGQLRRTHGLPDQPLPPSAALYKAPTPPRRCRPGQPPVWRRTYANPGRAPDHIVSLTVRDRPRLERRTHYRLIGKSG